MMVGAARGVSPRAVLITGRQRMTNLGKKFEPEPLTEDEAERVLDAIKGNGPLAVRNRALVAMLWRSGVRVSEALSLKPSDIDFVHGMLNIRRGKGSKQRIAVIDRRAIDRLGTWL